ncbi:MAG: FecR domain-containing protein, partial [Phormidesmis sp. CAN_BIN36]|nr:FecR domain-containing protein [Phormidesmis sp. CAN_BIN36]
MSRNLFLVVTLSLLSASTLLLPTPVSAETPLKFADIQALLRQVRLLPRNQPARPARVNERLLTGDALSTARSSKADLRFNDGSFARVGELALFRFIPNTRQFSLSNGTALLLIPPGRGTTTIKTPNVSAGIRGSALFVRVDEQTGTTIVGALTSSGITVTDNVTNRLVELKAGQMAVADPRGLRLFDFDLNTFYQTSNIVRGLNLEQKPSAASLDQDIAAVQGETSEALSKQEKIPDEAIAKNIDFIKLSPQPSDRPEEKAATLLPVDLPSVGKPDIFDRDTVGTRQQKPSNLETSEVGQPSLPNIPPTPSDKPLQTPTITTPPEPEVGLIPPAVTTPPVPGVGLTPIQRGPAAVQGPEGPAISPVTQPPVILTQVTSPVQVTPAPVAVPVNPPIQVTPAPVIPPVRVTPAPVVTPSNPPVRVTPAPVVTPLNPPIQVAPAPVIDPVTPPIQVAPAPVVTPLNPPVQVVPAPVIVPVTPPIQVAPAPVIAPLNPPI